MLPAAPNQSWAEALSGRGHLLLRTVRSLFHQPFHLAGEAWHDVPTPLMQRVLPLGGFYPSLASSFPAQDCPPNGPMLSLRVMTLKGFCHGILRYFDHQQNYL